MEGGGGSVEDSESGQGFNFTKLLVKSAIAPTQTLAQNMLFWFTKPEAMPNFYALFPKSAQRTTRGPQGFLKSFILLVLRARRKFGNIYS